MGLGTGFKVTVGLQSQKAGGENIMAKPQPPASMSGFSQKGDNNPSTRYRAIPTKNAIKNELRSSQKAASSVRSGSNVNEDSDVDNLRRKIRLAIRQRQRKEKS